MVRKSSQKPKAPSGPSSDAELGELVDYADHATRRHPLARGFVLGALLTAAMAIFVAQNRQSVDFDWLWIDFEADLWIVLVVAFAAGAVASPLLLYGLYRSRRDQRQVRQTVGRVKRRAARREAQPQPPPATGESARP